MAEQYAWVRRTRRLGVAAALVAVVVAFASVAFVLVTLDDDDAQPPNDRRSERSATLPFPAIDRHGRQHADENVHVVDGSEIVAIFGRPSPHTVALQLSGDPERVIDGYAAQIGCGRGSDDGPYMNICSRTPLSLHRNGRAGEPSYTLEAAETAESGSWIGLLSYSGDDADPAVKTTARGSDRKPLEALAVDELPFPRGDPDGHGFGDRRVQVVDGSEVLSIIDQDYGFVVVLRITGDVETVFDGYATELGCGRGSSFEHAANTCDREPNELERIGSAGSDFYTLMLEEGSGGQSSLAVLFYTRG